MYNRHNCAHPCHAESYAKQAAISNLVTPWIIFYAVAVVVSTAAVYIKLKVFYEETRSAFVFI